MLVDFGVQNFLAGRPTDKHSELEGQSKAVPGETSERLEAEHDERP